MKKVYAGVLKFYIGDFLVRQEQYKNRPDRSKKIRQLLTLGLLDIPGAAYTITPHPYTLYR